MHREFYIKLYILYFQHHIYHLSSGSRLDFTEFWVSFVKSLHAKTIFNFEFNEHQCQKQQATTILLRRGPSHTVCAWRHLVAVQNHSNLHLSLLHILMVAYSPGFTTGQFYFLIFLMYVAHIHEQFISSDI